MKSEEITVIIPAYNAEKYIEEAVSGIRSQTLGPDAGILVIDDGSSDRTAEIAESLNVTLFRKERGGASTARNVGIREVKTPFIYMLDADDVAVPEAFQLLSDAIGDCDAAFGLAEDFVSPELTEEQAKLLVPREAPYTGILPGCSLIRTSVFQEVGLFDESLKSGEVVAWMLAFRDQKRSAVNVSQTVLRRRLHMTNTGRVDRAQEARNYADLLRRRLRNGK